MDGASAVPSHQRMAPRDPELSNDSEPSITRDCSRLRMTLPLVHSYGTWKEGEAIVVTSALPYSAPVLARLLYKKIRNAHRTL